MIVLQNGMLEARFTPQGAELQGLRHQGTGLDYLWNADPAFWGKHAPLLFPVVGQLRDNRYTYAGKEYTMNRHGFAREQLFETIRISESEVTFSLRDSEASARLYPFPFRLDVTYSLTAHTLRTRYEVTNPGPDMLLYAIGAHPAFRLPLTPDTVYEDYYLEFEQEETAPRWQLSGGLLESPTPFLEESRRIPLSKDLFRSDALVFKHLRSRSVSLRSEATPHGLSVRFEGFPYLGIWAAPEAPFVCIEPWDGIADTVAHNGILEQKEGIQKIAPGTTRALEWDITCW